MLSLNLYQGKVVTNSDLTHPDGKKAGRIQVKVYPDNKDVPDTMCPWFRPFFSTKTSLEYSYDPIPIGSLVWILSVPEFQGAAFYLPTSFIDGFFNPSTVDSSLAAVTEASIGSYPDLSFNKTVDGSIMFHNKTNGAMGILHKSGSYVIINETGDIIQRSASTTSIEVKKDNTIEISGKVKITETSSGIPTAAGTLETGPTSAGDPSSIGKGAFLVVPTCVVTGAPISCYKIIGT